MVQKIRKAVFPVAGLGTRFLPATKAMPKEMLTVVDKPIIQYAVEEAVAAGITEFIFVTGRGKSAIENHFDQPYELAEILRKKGKDKELASVMDILPAHCRAYYTRQGEPKGLGHAVWCAREIVGNEPFAVLLPDDIIWSAENVLAGMMDAYARTDVSTVLTMEVPLERTANYGILDVEDATVKHNCIRANNFVEKPGPEKAPSRYAIMGRYIFHPRIFDFLGEHKIGTGGEIQLTDAMTELCKEHGFYGYLLNGQRFDCGDKVGFQQANLFFALQDPYIGPRLQDFIRTLDFETATLKVVNA